MYYLKANFMGVVFMHGVCYIEANLHGKVHFGASMMSAVWNLDASASRRLTIHYCGSNFNSGHRLCLF